MPSGSRLITLDARPEPVRIEAGPCAVLVVDMQNDFGAKGGMFDRAGIDIAPVQSAVEPTARVLDAARAAGLPVVYLVMQFRPDLSDAGAPDAPNRIKHAPWRSGRRCRRRTVAPGASSSRTPGTPRSYPRLLRDLATS